MATMKESVSARPMVRSRTRFVLPPTRQRERVLGLRAGTMIASGVAARRRSAAAVTVQLLRRSDAARGAGPHRPTGRTLLPMFRMTWMCAVPAVPARMRMRSPAPWRG